MTSPNPAPGTAAVLTEVARRLERFDTGPRATGERLWHVNLLWHHLRRCRRGGLPYRNALIGIAVQAVMWAAALEDQS